MLALAGGVGGSKLASGLADIAGDGLAVIVNTADDFDHLGLRICPDLDTVTYALAGIANPQTGWGIVDETWSCLERLAALGGDDWFRLGDKDLATHILRTHYLRQGETLTAVTERFRQRLRIAPAIFPMTDQPVRTLVRTAQGELGFQHYFVKLRCEVPVLGFLFQGIEAATIPAPLEAQLSPVLHDLIVICPSNPFVSVDPILSVPHLRERLLAMRRPVVAVSPIIGGAAVKGPAAKMIRELAMPVSPVSIARHYRGLIHGIVIDEVDAAHATEVEKLGIHVRTAETLMTGKERQRKLAETCIRFGEAIACTLQ
ncbi:MAG: 2-phospho-L-lactate transferase [Pseudorhodoplanes sp.]|nr:2-phospho-L-lactate transferase [Pseudorhodoplanes sp.]